MSIPEDSLIPFKSVQSDVPIIWRETTEPIAKERGLSLSENQVQGIEQFLRALIKDEASLDKNTVTHGKDIEFLKSLGIRS